jgi:hypothetical protein
MRVAAFAVWLGATVLLVAPELARCAAPEFSISAKAEYAEVKSGSEVLVNVTLTNLSSHVVSFELSSPLCDYVVEVRDGTGRLLPDTEAKSKSDCVHPHASGEYGIYRLKPNESLTRTIPISMFSDVSRPGDYSVQVAWIAQKELGTALVRAETIKITVIP